jgi:hypothetical protein
MPEDVLLCPACNAQKILKTSQLSAIRDLLESFAFGFAGCSGGQRRRELPARAEPDIGP